MPSPADRLPPPVRLLGISVAAATLLVGCTTNHAAGHQPANAISSSSQTASPSASGSAPLADPRFAHGVPSAAPIGSPAPPAPDTIGAAAQQSITDVVDLHNLANAVADAVPMPAGSVTAQAHDVQQRFAAVITALGHPAASSPAANLAAALNGYNQIALQLQSTKPPTTLAGQLQHLDAQWRAALALIDGGTGSRLSQMVPPLLTPTPQHGGAPRPPAPGSASP